MLRPRLNDLAQYDDERGKIFASDLPQLVRVDSPVHVNQHMPHGHDLPPGNDGANARPGSETRAAASSIS